MRVGKLMLTSSGVMSCMAILCAYFWDDLADKVGLSDVCPVLMRQGSRVSALSSTVNAVGARWALPTYTRSELGGYGFSPEVLLICALAGFYRFVGFAETAPILLGMNGDVFDVSAGRRFYGPDAGYKIFAGVDATRSLSLGSLDPADAAPPLCNDMRDFNDKPAAWDTLLEQHAFYGSKYGRVGRLVEEDGSDAVYLLPDGSQHRGPVTAAQVAQQKQAGTTAHAEVPQQEL